MLLFLGPRLFKWTSQLITFNILFSDASAFCTGTDIIIDGFVIWALNFVLRPDNLVPFPFSTCQQWLHVLVVGPRAIHEEMTLSQIIDNAPGLPRTGASDAVKL